MAENDKVLISRSTMEDIGDAIREATEGTAQYLPAQMPAAIRALRGGVDASSIAPEFNRLRQYSAGDLVFYNKVLYRFTSAHRGAWTGSDVTETTVAAELSDKQEALTFDSTPTEGSLNPVTSGGIYSAITGAAPASVPITLTAGGWQNGTQTVTVTGVLADETKQLIQPVPSSASREAYLASNVQATAQAANSLTFSCDTVPSGSLTVYVVITRLYDNTPIGVTWATDSWASIQKTSEQGKTAEIYGSQVGATRSITLTNGNTMTIRLSNATNNMYSLSDGSRTTGLCMEFVDCFPDAWSMNTSSTNAGGWNATNMRTVRMAQLFDLLPADLQAVIATVDIKASSGGSSGSTVVTSQDKLFLLAEREIFATRLYSLQAEWDALTRWQWYADHDTNADRVKKRNGSARFWWERSAFEGTSDSFGGVYSGGDAHESGASLSGSVSPGFCI